MFWTPIILLYTGARAEEICQLSLDDVKQVDDVWIFDINEDSEDKRIKTVNSKRQVPVHPDLIRRFGLIKRIEWLQHNKQIRLFPELHNKTGGRYSHNVSSWFTRYKNKLGFSDKQCLHSFRHTFTNYCKQIGVEESKIAECIGHKVQGETLGRYGKPYSPQILLDDVIMKLDFINYFPGDIQSKFMVL
jgi:integrase